MKTIIVLVLIGFLILPLLIPKEAISQTTGGQQVQTVPSVNVIDALYRIAQWLWTILLMVAVIFIIVGAYYFVTAAGNPDQITKARAMVLYAAIGVIVAGMAWGIVRILRAIV